MRCYLQTEVFGLLAEKTFDGKARDLSTFTRWFEAADGRTAVRTRQNIALDRVGLTHIGCYIRKSIFRP